ncbi:MAG: DUF2442 domain-containing protein [Chloroflexi bacterium]|nr:DUF2442 domain-containing protein [Chloroflexota bacterium]
MSILAEIEVITLARSVRFDDERMIVLLTDSREVSVPIAWYPRLAQATPQQRNNWRLVGDGEGIHWPDVDEDLPVAGILLGLRPPPSLAPKPK